MLLKEKYIYIHNNIQKSRIVFVAICFFVWIVFSWAILGPIFSYTDKYMGLNRVFYGPFSEELFKLLAIYKLQKIQKIQIKYKFFLIYCLIFSFFEQFINIIVIKNDFNLSSFEHIVISCVAFSISILIKFVGHSIISAFEIFVYKKTHSVLFTLLLGALLHFLINAALGIAPPSHSG